MVELKIQLEIVVSVNQAEEKRAVKAQRSGRGSASYKYFSCHVRANTRFSDFLMACLR